MPHVGRWIGQPFRCHRKRRLSGERRLTGNQLEEHAAEAVHVAPSIELAFAKRLFGTHVLGCAERQSGLGEPFRLGRRGGECDPEVGHDGNAFVKQDVLRLDVAMDHVVRVGVVERGRDLPDEIDRSLDRNLFFAIEHVPQRLAFDVRHDVEEHVVRFSRVVQREDVGMAEICGELDLSTKAVVAERGGNFGPKHLEGDVALMFHVAAEVHRRHSAVPNLSAQHVPSGESRIELLELIG